MINGIVLGLHIPKSMNVCYKMVNREWGWNGLVTLSNYEDRTNDKMLQFKHFLMHSSNI